MPRGDGPLRTSARDAASVARTPDSIDVARPGYTACVLRARGIRAALATAVARRPVRTAAALIVVAMVVMITRGHRASSGDAAHYLVIAHSVAFDRDLDVANNYGDPLLPDVSAGPHARPGRDGIVRPVHDVGLGIAAAPFYAVAYHLAAASSHLPESVQRRAKLTPSIALRQLVSLGMIALTVAFSVNVLRSLLRAEVPAAVAVGATAIWALSPPVLSHGFLFFTELPTAALACSLFLSRERAQSRRGPALFGLGLATGLLAVLHARNVGLVAGLAVIFIWRLRADRARAFAYGAGAFAGIAVKIFVTYWFWGSLMSPHEQMGGWTGSAVDAASETLTRVIGLLGDPRHGLLWSAPIYVLLPIAWWNLRRTDPTVARELAIVAAAYLILVLLPFTNAHGWRGGWSPAARFLMPLAGLAALTLPGLIETRHRTLIGIVVAAQLTISLTFWLEPALFWSEGPGTAAHLVRLLGPVASRIPAVTGLTIAVVAWAAVWIAVSAALFVVLRPRATELPAAEAS